VEFYEAYYLILSENTCWTLKAPEMNTQTMQILDLLSSDEEDWERIWQHLKDECIAP